MDSIEQARETMRQRVKEAMIRKTKTKVQQECECEHEYQTFKETLSIDNNNFTQKQAYFTIRACLLCKDKKRTNLVVE